MVKEAIMIETILKRRSIRKYTKEPVSEEVIKELLEAAMAAPSAGNEQPWHFIVIRDRATLDKIPDVHPYSFMIKEAPLAILVCGDVKLAVHGEMWTQDCSAATQNLLLAITANKLGAVWLGVYPRQERIDGLRNLLGIPENIVPFSLIPIGHPAEEKPLTVRFNKERVHNNKW
jgi:nitroreductase